MYVTQTPTCVQRPWPLLLCHSGNSRALWALWAVAIHSVYRQMSQMQGYWHYHIRKSFEQTNMQELASQLITWHFNHWKVMSSSTQLTCQIWNFTMLKQIYVYIYIYFGGVSVYFEAELFMQKKMFTITKGAFVHLQPTCLFRYNKDKAKGKKLILWSIIAC